MNPNNLTTEIAAPGVEITLINGSTSTIRYNFSAMIEIENKHGSINGLLEQLNAGDRGSLFSTLAHALWAGTARKMPLEAFIDLLDPARLGQYTEAFSSALTQGLGQSEDDQGEAGAVEATATTTEPSPGTTSTI